MHSPFELGMFYMWQYYALSCFIIHLNYSFFIWLLVLNIDYVFDILINVRDSSMKRKIGDIKNCEDM